VDVLAFEDAVLTYAEQVAPKAIGKHYTPLALARHLVELVPIEGRDRVIDPAAGKSRAFVSSFPVAKRMHCEIEEGIDFLNINLSYEWAITNPPYHLLWDFIDKASREASKGFAFLVNINGINTLTPKRLELLRQRRFHLRRLHVCQVKQWFGRYYFYVFAKQRGRCEVSWDLTPWQ
jgi:hypothetical protein